MEFLRFVFSSFWVWLGFVILVGTVGGGLVNLVKACKPEKHRVQTFRSRDILRVDIVGATDEEDILCTSVLWFWVSWPMSARPLPGGWTCTSGGGVPSALRACLEQGQVAAVLGRFHHVGVGLQAAANTENVKAKAYIAETTEAIAAAVAATNQTYVDALKNAGKFDAEAQKEAAQKALAACLESISPAAQKFIEAAYGDIREYLTTQIEADVRRQKCYMQLPASLPIIGELVSTAED